MHDNDIQDLIAIIAKLPGLGQRSARRIVLHLLADSEIRLTNLINVLSATKNNIRSCNKCFNLDISDPCNICSNEKRDHQTLAIVETVADLWAMERSHIFNGIYHVLGGTLSAGKNFYPDDLHLPHIINRCNEGHIKEVIIATNATIEGQTTAFYIMEQLQEHNIYVSRLASGIPVGGELDYVDEGTLSAALQARKAFNDS